MIFASGDAPKVDALPQAVRRHSDQPRMRFARHAQAITAVGFAAFALACGRASGAPDLRIGVSPWPGYEMLYLAQEKGLFDERDGAIRLIEHTSMNDSRRAYSRGQVDAFAGTLVELLLTRDQGPRMPTAFLAVDVSNGADALIAHAPIDSASGLRGKRVGIEPGTVGLLLLSRALERAGLGLSDVTLHWIDGAAIVDAFSHSEVDAIVTYPPHSLAIAAADGRRIFSSADIPGEIVDVIMIDAARLQQRPGDAQRVIEGFRRAQAYARAHPDEAVSVMAAREGITPAAFREALAGGIDMLEADEQTALLAPGGPAERALGELERAMREIGLVTGSGCQAGCITSVATTLARGGD